MLRAGFGSMPVYLQNVDWGYVSLLAAFVLIASGLGNVLSFNHRGFAAVLAAVIFASIFVFWSYYPHGLPLPTRLGAP